MIKGLFATLIFLAVFFTGMKYAVLHPKISKEIIATLDGYITLSSTHK
jgi:hypothetical protein